MGTVKTSQIKVYVQISYQGENVMYVKVSLFVLSSEGAIVCLKCTIHAMHLDHHNPVLYNLDISMKDIYLELYHVSVTDGEPAF